MARYSSTSISIRGMKCHVHKWNLNDNNETPADVPPPRALIIIYHGFLAHGNYPTVRYAAECLAAQNYAVVAVDMPGHGKSEGIRGYLESADTVNKDGVVIVEHATKMLPAGENSTTKVFLVGSSMGGAIALRVAHEMTTMVNKVSGVILLAPMLQLNVSPLERTLLSGVSYLVPTWELIPSSATSPEKQYRDETKRNECQNDELCVSGSKLKAASALSCVDITLKVREQFKSITVPFLLMIADEDVVVKNEGSEELFRTCASEDKTKKNYPALHGLLCEPSPLFDDITKDMLDWLEKRTTETR